MIKQDFKHSYSHKGVILKMKYKHQTHCSAWFYVNVTQARVSSKEGTLIEKMPP